MSTHRYATRVWHEDLENIEDHLNEVGFHDTNSVITHLVAHPTGSQVLVMELDEDMDPMLFGAIDLETFNQYNEWQDRDDTLGPFTRIHKK